MYKCETSSLTLKEESKLRMLEDRLLRRIFGPHREEKQETIENCIYTYVKKKLHICTVTCRHTSRQRPKYAQATIEKLLQDGPLLGNDSVNIFSRQRMRRQQLDKFR
jgi:hypothetical protein